MNHNDVNAPAYGLWTLVLINSAIFVLFAFSFFRPRTTRDWRTFGTFSAFIVALFVEMYGFPLTLYLLASWLANRFPGVDFFSHEAGHLWYRLFGLGGDPHLSLIHLASNALVVLGFFLLAAAWRVLYHAQLEGRLAMAGPYAYIRHPQYAAFILIMVGFLLQWPTLITLAMFPILVAVYVRLAHREDKDAKQRFGVAWERYARGTPRWIPSVGGRGARHASRTLVAKGRQG